MKAKRTEGIDIASSYAKILPRLRDGTLAELPLSSIGKEQLADWISTEFKVEGAEQVHPETFNTARRRCVTLWKWARDEGCLPKLAKTVAEEIKTRKDSVARRCDSAGGARGGGGVCGNECVDIVATEVQVLVLDLARASRLQGPGPVARMSRRAPVMALFLDMWII